MKEFIRVYAITNNIFHHIGPYTLFKLGNRRVPTIKHESDSSLASIMENFMNEGIIKNNTLPIFITTAVIPNPYFNLGTTYDSQMASQAHIRGSCVW
eukprot:CAMPEP_0201482866 /NCGR_PEP_ID=MMETSP0151_2-20130828/7127_1 /ASSEMBLY_ACC=CAM_ASM_000257 /TAXON_ID=200890 /ORGANISM="Paramoeba atlantica, Strain 621/1 / CCAP 1560/9" /LENGTH=96 /DNA_ID=CAMNT_0047865765 /DNA_START=143 /DNA_END=430 /DNA_ORIENTATION=+